MSKALTNHLREWGLNVEVADGAYERGRPYTFTPKYVIAHHTASAAGSGNEPSRAIVTYGRSDLPGPLSQFLLCRDGKVVYIAEGYANHAGEGGPYLTIPANQGNTYAFGIEAENNGLGEKWPAKQLNAYYRLCAALLDFMDVSDVRHVLGHKEWTSRKIDPAGIDMNVFRRNVASALDHGPSAVKVRLSLVEPGKRNKSVLRVSRRLAKRGYLKKPQSLFDSDFRQAFANYQFEELGYTEPNGLPGKKSLEELGFEVLT